MAESLKSFKEKILSLRRPGKNYNEIVSILGCNKSTISYHCTNNGLGGIISHYDVNWDDVNNYYQKNSAKNTANFFNISEYSVKTKCKKNRYKSENTPEILKHRSVLAVQKRRSKVKIMAVEYKGGSCEVCGYNTSLRALHFHHTDPTEKEFNLSQRGHCYSWEKVKKRN